MVEYAFSNQGSVKNIFQGMCEDKIVKTVINTVSYIHIKIIIIILIPACHHTLIQAFHHTLPQTSQHTLIQACHHNQFVCIQVCTSTPIYATSDIPHCLHIALLGYLYQPPPSRLPSSMYQKTNIS